MSGPEEVDQTAPEVLPEDLGLTLVMQGTFAVYGTRNKGVELFYNIGDGTQRKSVPPAVVKMLQSGPIAKMMNRMAGEIS